MKTSQSAKSPQSSSLQGLDLPGVSPAVVNDAIANNDSSSVGSILPMWDKYFNVLQARHAVLAPATKRDAANGVLGGAAYGTDLSIAADPASSFNTQQGPYGAFDTSLDRLPLSLQALAPKKTAPTQE